MTKDCKKKSIWARLIVIAVLACTASNAQAQLIAGRTNALLWGNLTPNFSLELVTSNRTSVVAGGFSRAAAVSFTHMELARGGRGVVEGGEGGV